MPPSSDTPLGAERCLHPQTHMGTQQCPPSQTQVVPTPGLPWWLWSVRRGWWRGQGVHLGEDRWTTSQQMGGRCMGSGNGSLTPRGVGGCGQVGGCWVGRSPPCPHLLRSVWAFSAPCPRHPGCLHCLEGRAWKSGSLSGLPPYDCLLRPLCSQGVTSSQ